MQEERNLSVRKELKEDLVGRPEIDKMVMPSRAIPRTNQNTVDTYEKRTWGEDTLDKTGRRGEMQDYSEVNARA